MLKEENALSDELKAKNEKIYELEGVIGKYEDRVGELEKEIAELEKAIAEMIRLIIKIDKSKYVKKIRL